MPVTAMRPQTAGRTHARHEKVRAPVGRASLVPSGGCMSGAGGALAYGNPYACEEGCGGWL
jgi:hypothetical protein